MTNDKINSRRPIAVDLFAGAGGFSLGIEQAGFDVLVAVESDPLHAAVYAYNFPQTKVLCADITTLSGAEIHGAIFPHSPTPPLPHSPPQIDLVFGGPPCQGFSVMGKSCVEDDRNDLVFHFRRLVMELQPRYFIMENVPGILTKRYASLLERLILAFQDCGYSIAQKVKVLNAADFGVPQQRKRLFLLGSRNDQLPLFYPPLPKLDKVTVRDAIADLPDLDDFEVLLQTDQVLLSDLQLQDLEQLCSDYVAKLRGIQENIDDRAYKRAWDRQLLTSSRRTKHHQTCRDRFLGTPTGKLESISRLRRLDWEGMSYTLRAGTGSDKGRYTSPRPIHPTKPRVISVREAARLHSFPDWFRFHTTKWHGMRQVGNSVPPLLAQAVGEIAIASLSIFPSKPLELLDLGDPKLLQFNPVQAYKYWQCHDLHH